MIHIMLWLNKNKIRAVFFLIGWTALIFYLCLKPMEGIPKFAIPHLDKILHIILFGGFNYLYLNYLTIVDGKILILSVILTFVFGLLIEIIQKTGIFGARSFEMMDIVADTTGGIISALFYYFIFKKKK